QQGITEGKDRSGFGAGLLVGGVFLVIVIIVIVFIVIGVIAFLVLRGRSKSAAGAAPSAPRAAPAKAAPYAPAPTPALARASDKTIDLSQTVAINRSDTAPINFGAIKFTAGALTGQRFDVKPEGVYIGRDAASAQIVVNDPRISKRHVWVGVRD